MNKTVIITPAFNKFEMATKPFLQSLYQYTDENSFDLIIIDNGSTDGTVEYLENFAKEHSNIRLILNKENLGYSKANNQGINLALEGNYKYIGLLNNDILFTPDWLKNTLEVFDFVDNPGKVNSILAKNDIIIDSISKKSVDLEDYFMKVIGGNKDA